MSLDRTSTLRLTGLILAPNEYGTYPAGACSVCDNVLFREIQKAESALDTHDPLTFGRSGGEIRHVEPLDNGVPLSVQRDSTNAWEVYYDQNIAALPSPISSDKMAMFNSAGYVSSHKARSRVFMNGQKGILVGDTTSPTTTAHRTLRWAGMPQPCFVGLYVIPETGGCLPAWATVSYRLVYRRDMGDYSLISTPSVVRQAVTTAASKGQPIIYLPPAAAAGLTVGDIVEVYRTNGIVAADLASMNYFVDPGADFYLIDSHALTSADLSDGYLTLTDRQPLIGPLYQTSGRLLYSSPNVEGALQINRQPPVSRATAQWGTFSFFGGVTDRPQWEFAVPGGIGTELIDATPNPIFHRDGIGNKKYVGSCTSGAATITGISSTVGIVAGMRITNSPAAVSGTPVVVSTTSTTVTIDRNWASSVSTQPFTFTDVLEVNGTQYEIYGLSTLINVVGGLGCEVTATDIVWWLEGGIPTAVIAPLRTGDIIVEPLRHSTMPSITVRGTNGQNYSPVIPQISDPAKIIQAIYHPNLLRWSKDNEPEHVAPANETFVGNGAIVTMEPTRDCLWIFCTDGIYRLSGYAGVWEVHPIVLGCVPCSPQCVARILDRVYAMTNRGLVLVSDTGVQELSSGIINPLEVRTTTFNIAGTAFQETPKVQLSADERREELYLLVQGATGDDPSAMVAYNTRYSAFSTINFLDQRISNITYTPVTSTAGEDGHPLVSKTTGAASQPTMYHWDSRSGGPLKPTVMLQPFYATSAPTNDPWVMKRWVDCTWLFDQVGGEQEVYGAYNDYLSTAGISRIRNVKQDAKVTFGVPRDVARAPSISPSIRMQSSPSEPVHFRGVSLRYRNFTTQGESRR